MPAGLREKPHTTRGAAGGGATGTADTGTADTAGSRLERLPWSSWHRTLLLRLGVTGATTWFVLGLAVGSAPSSAGWRTAVAGLCAGGLVLGALADRFGRRQIWLPCLAACVLVAGTAAATGPGWQTVYCFGLAAAAGGSVPALWAHTAETAPARARGWCVQAVVAAGWLGLAAGVALGSVLASGLVGAAGGGSEVARRLGLGTAAAVALVVLARSRTAPESPRWLWWRGRRAEANRILVLAAGTLPDLPAREAQRTVSRQGSPRQGSPGQSRPGQGVPRQGIPAHQALVLPGALAVGAVAAVVTASATGWPGSAGVSGGTSPALVVAAFAGSAGLGPAALGRLSDAVGRRWVLVPAYLGGALVLAGAAALVQRGAVSPGAAVACWSLVLLLVCGGAAAVLVGAYETAPVGVRALTAGASLALASAVAAGVAALASAPGSLAWAVGVGYAASLALAATAVVGSRLHVGAARRTLEDVPRPAGERNRQHTLAAAERSVARPGLARPWEAGRERVVRAGHRSWAVTAGLPADHPGRTADVARILHALGRSTLARDELEAWVAKPDWQPGRFRAALRAALAAGHVVEVDHGRFARAVPPVPPVPPARPGH